MAGLPDAIPDLVAALARVIDEEGRKDIARLLISSKVAIEQTSFDNWNGGTHGYTVQLGAPARSYAAVSDKVGALEEEMQSRLQSFTRLYPNENVDAVVIVPSLKEDGPQSASEVSTSFWREGYFRLFISHIAKYKKEASLLSADLSGHGIVGFVAHEDIEPTKEWEDEIRSALSSCDSLTCLLTEGFSESKWADQEVGFAIGRGILVIPVRLGMDPYGFISRFQGLAGRVDNTSRIASDLVAILAKHPATSERMAAALVTMFEKSGSYAEAKSNAKKLELITAWNGTLTARVKAALKANDQIANAFGVSARVKQILGQRSAR
jgi:hypothetical protein